MGVADDELKRLLADFISGKEPEDSPEGLEYSPDEPLPAGPAGAGAITNRVGFELHISPTRALCVTVSQASPLFIGGTTESYARIAGAKPFRILMRSCHAAIAPGEAISGNVPPCASMTAAT